MAKSSAAETPGEWVYACDLESVKKRSIVTVTIDGQQFILVREGTRIFAADRACPHEGADLAQGRCAAGKLLCPRHLAWFDLQDGAVTGWDFDPLRTYPVRIIDSQIWIQLRG